MLLGFFFSICKISTNLDDQRVLCPSFLLHFQQLVTLHLVPGPDVLGW